MGNKMVIIYHPNGDELKFTTKSLGLEPDGKGGEEEEYVVVNDIEAVKGGVKVCTHDEDGHPEQHTYSMPYQLTEWNNTQLTK